MKIFFHATFGKKGGLPGVIMAIQTFGDLVNFHPRLHAIASDGVFVANGGFYVLPKIDLKKLDWLFRHHVLQRLRREEKRDDALITKRLSWPHAGFSVHHLVRISGQDQAGWCRLAESVLRSPFFQEKLRYQAKS